MSQIKKLFKTAKPPNLEAYIGKTIVIEGKPVTIKSIVGNKFKHTFYEINGQHLIGMLRFHAQILGDKSITEEQFKAFEDMEITAHKKPDTKSSLEESKLLSESVEKMRKELNLDEYH